MDMTQGCFPAVFSGIICPQDRDAFCVVTLQICHVSGDPKVYGMAKSPTKQGVGHSRLLYLLSCPKSSVC